MERRNLPATITVEKRAGDDAPTIVGYGSVFYDPVDDGTEYELWSYAGERCVERIMPGAFDRALREDDVAGLFNHDVNMVLGRTGAKTMRLSVDSRGLRYEIDPPDTQAARDLLTSIRRGDVTGSSFSFKADGQTFRREEDGDNVLVVREVASVRLYDTGPVLFPAYGSATAGVRAVGDVADVRAAVVEWRRGEIARRAALNAIAVRARMVQLAEEAPPCRRGQEDRCGGKGGTMGPCPGSGGHGKGEAKEEATRASAKARSASKKAQELSENMAEWAGKDENKEDYLEPAKEASRNAKEAVKADKDGDNSLAKEYHNDAASAHEEAAEGHRGYAGADIRHEEAARAHDRAGKAHMVAARAHEQAK